MRKIVPADIVLGMPLPFSIFDENERLLLRCGVVVNMPEQVERLVARGALRDGVSNRIERNLQPATSSRPATAEETAPPFDRLGGLILNLKHVITTTLKSPEQIDVTARVSKIARAVQDICDEDIDAALAAPCLDFQNPYIVVHQMMGAVLTDLIARRKSISKEQRESLVCAALTRDLGQVPFQAELDKHVGPLPEILRARMFQHPDSSAKLLEEAGVIDHVWLNAVRGHHERLNGSGYPAALEDQGISIGARILAVADIYSAMEKPRPYRNKAHFPQNALKEIYLKKDAEVDGEIAHILINQIGLLPPGTIVKLKCGEIAVIKSPTVKAEGAIVYSIYGQAGAALTEPIQRDTSQPPFEITGLVPYADCRTATFVIRRIWSN